MCSDDHKSLFLDLYIALLFKYKEKDVIITLVSICFHYFFSCTYLFSCTLKRHLMDVELDPLVLVFSASFSVRSV